MLASQGLELLPEYGFNNTYAVVVRDEQAQDSGCGALAILKTMRSSPRLATSFSSAKTAGRVLAERYSLKQSVTGIEHGLAYQAIADGAIDITDAYSTDGELQRYRLRILKMTWDIFPSTARQPSCKPAPRLGCAKHWQGCKTCLMNLRFRHSTPRLQFKA